MAVKGPKSRIVGVEDDDHVPSRGEQNGVAHRSREARSVDLDDLKLDARADASDGALGSG